MEFLSGAWVMTDEANAHYYSILMQMFEGHEFLQNEFSKRSFNVMVFEF